MLNFNDFCNINNHLYKSPKSVTYSHCLGAPSSYKLRPEHFLDTPTRTFKTQAPNYIHQSFSHTTLSWLTPDQRAEMKTWEELAHRSILCLTIWAEPVKTSPFSPYSVHPVFVAFCLAPSQNHPADRLRVADCLQDEAVISQHSNRQEEAMVSDFYPRMVVLTS